MNPPPLHSPRRFAATLSALAIVLLPSMHSNAASILWNTPQPIVADTDVSTAGTLLYAFTFGHTGVPSTTVNGVSFASFATPNGGTSAVTVGSVTLTLQAGNYFRSTLTETGSASSPFFNLSGAYRSLLQSAVSDGIDPSSNTLTLGGLTNGTIYQVQLWVNESASFTNNLSVNTKTTLTAGNSVTLDSNIPDTTGGVGQWVSGTFTADTANQNIGFTGANPAGASPILNGFQVRVVPEPSSAALLLCGAALCLQRRTLRTH